VPFPDGGGGPPPPLGGGRAAQRAMPTLSSTAKATKDFIIANEIINNNDRTISTCKRRINQYCTD